MKERKNRDQIVLATKFTTAYRAGYGDSEIIINSTGNGTKSLHLSLEASLKKLQTSYIDLLYVHWWDFTCSIPELMQSLNVMVAQGKVLYLGISDTPAWIVSKANEYARQNGLRQFSVYQGRWSAEHRDFERDIIPMARDGKQTNALSPFDFHTNIRQRVWVSVPGELLEADTSNLMPNAKSKKVAKWERLPRMQSKSPRF